MARAAGGRNAALKARYSCDPATGTVSEC